MYQAKMHGENKPMFYKYETGRRYFQLNECKLHGRPEIISSNPRNKDQVFCDIVVVIITFL